MKNPTDYLPKDIIKGTRDGNNRSTLSALRRRERAARIATGERPRNVVASLNAAYEGVLDKAVDTARALRLAGSDVEIVAVRTCELHPTKGYRSRTVWL